jgi:hypothetical protein
MSGCRADPSMLTSRPRHDHVVPRTGPNEDHPRLWRVVCSEVELDVYEGSAWPPGPSRRGHMHLMSPSRVFEGRVRGRMLTLPRLKLVGFSVQRSRPSCDGLTRSPRAFGHPRDGPVPVCPTVRIWRVRLATVPTAIRIMASLVLARPSFLVPSWFYPAEGFPAGTGNHEFPKNGPRGDALSCTGFHVPDRDRTPSSHAWMAWAFGSILCKVVRF